MIKMENLKNYLYWHWKIFVFQIVQPTDAGPCFPGHLDSKQFAEVSMELSSLERAPTLILIYSGLTHAVWKEMQTWCFGKRQLTTFVVKLSSGKLELSLAFRDILLVIFTRQPDFARARIFAFHVLLVTPWMGLTWVFLMLCNIFACYQPSNSKSFKLCLLYRHHPYCYSG